MRNWILLLMAAAVNIAGARNLDFYFVDVEGGQATLMVTPAGQSMLVDAGWPGFNGRDADRIVAAAKKAGLKSIDYFVLTHYHRDHVGGLEQLAEKFPILNFVDHGPNTETGKGAEELNASHARAIAKGKHLVVKPGDRIPIKGAEVTVVTARGERIGAALKGAGQPNGLCASAAQRKPDPSENARSLGVIVQTGKFRMLDLGDLTWNKELELVCPNNLIGKVDLYLTTHHGMDASGPAQIVHAVAPRVAIMNNGARKGGTPVAWKVVRASPGLEDLWQVHTSVEGGKDNNTNPDMIANTEEEGTGFGLQVSVSKDGSFVVTNERNGFKKTYAKK